MRKISRLCHAVWVWSAVGLLGSASAFAEQWPRATTIARAVQTAATVVGARQAGRDRQIGVVTSMTVRELEAWLRRRSSRVDPRPETRDRSAPASRRGAYRSGLVMPVAGVSYHDLQDSFGDPRSGGRSHMGIDIFAPRWTAAVACVDGYVTAIDNGARAGRSLWLVGNDRRAFFYAHLQQWADGIYDGMPVRAGEVIGYVGNSGNAAGSPTHLHFETRDRGGNTVNPYHVLVRAEPVDRPIQVARNRKGGRRTG
jgi:murein DD-endopeptidase MepM/ murein hydrolase activator NlpD